MKFSIIACAVTGALALTNQLVDRDAAEVTSILGNVKKSLEALDAAVKGYTGDKATILKASNDLISTLTDGKTKVDASAVLDLNDAVSLTTPVQDLTKTGQALAADLKDFKATVEKEGECTLVRTQVGNVNDASQALIKAVVSKVPQEAQQIAAQLSAPLTKVLQESVDEFSEQNCKDSGNGGSSPSSSAAGSSSAPASSAPASSAPASSAAPTGSASAPATSAPKPTSAASGSASSSSGPASTAPPVVTAGAAAMAPLGAAAIAVAALLL